MIMQINVDKMFRVWENYHLCYREMVVYIHVYTCISQNYNKL